MTNFLNMVWALAQSPLIYIFTPVIIFVLVITYRAEKDLRR